MVQVERIITLPSLNVYWNLAIEQAQFVQNNLNENLLLLWRNNPSIVIGRHQVLPKLLPNCLLESMA